MLTTMAEVFDRIGQFFMGRSPQHEAARRIASALDELGIPYAPSRARAATRFFPCGP